jgi:hypothetical protein
MGVTERKWALEDAIKARGVELDDVRTKRDWMEVDAIDGVLYLDPATCCSGHCCGHESFQVDADTLRKWLAAVEASGV